MRLQMSTKTGSLNVGLLLNNKLETIFEMTPSNCDHYGLLHDAAERGDEQCVGMLLKLGMDPDVRYKGETPLHASARTGMALVVEQLAGAGANVDAEDAKGRRPLCYAAENGDADVVRLLLDAGAEDAGQMALHGACRGGHGDVAQLLLDFGGDVGGAARCRTWTPLDTALRFCHSRHAGAQRCPFEVLQAHAARLTVAGVAPSERTATFLRHGVAGIVHSCKQELSRLRTIRVDGRQVTFADLLFMGMGRLVKVVGNEDVLEAVNRDEFVCDFPQYSELIRCRVRKALKRRELLILCELILSSLDVHRLPHSVLWDHVFVHLDTEDLVNFASAIVKH